MGLQIALQFDSMKGDVLKQYLLGFLALILVFIGAPLAASAQAPLCSRIFATDIKVRELNELARLRVMTYNLENFNYNVRKLDRDPRAQEKYENIAEVILDQRPEVLVLQEVHSKKSLEDFNSDLLQDRYEVFVVSGNESGGMNLAFMLKRDLNLKTEIKSHKDQEWYDPAQKEVDYLFDRDFPALILREGNKDHPALIVFAHHGKSMMDRPGDPKSVKMRTEQIRRMEEILIKFSETYGKETPTIVAGDFNTDVLRSSEISSLKNVFRDVFDFSPIVRDLFDRYTHTFHPHLGPTQATALDAIFVNGTLRDSIKSARVFHYRDEMGFEKPLPTSSAERAENPSDHFPIIVDIDVQPLLGVEIY